MSDRQGGLLVAATTPGGALAPPTSCRRTSRASDGAGRLSDAGALSSRRASKAGADASDATAVVPLERGLSAGLRVEPIQRLYEELCQAFAQEKALGYVINNCQAPESFARLDARVRALFGTYLASCQRDYGRFVHFNQHHYVRNLVEVNDDFELLVVCWQRGQASRVHNHADSHGWLMPLEGEMEERHFDPEPLPSTRPSADAPPLPGVIAATTPCPGLRHTRTSRFVPGDVAYINDHQGLHSIHCPEDCPGEAPGGITLHLYAPPIRRVKLYEPENDRVVQRIPGFFSIRGQRVPESA